MRTRSIHALKGGLAAAAVAATLALSGCGGGGDDTPPVTSQVPTSASQTSASFVDYVRQLVASVNTDDFMPVDLSAVTNPPEDNDSPPLVLTQ